ncbi:MAG: hypothetical protein D6744_16625, partial [Planctomycetota bacterium]
MTTNDRTHARRRIATTLLWLSLLPLISGCPMGAPAGYAPADVPAATLTEGEFDTLISPSQFNVYWVNVPANRGLTVVALPLERSRLSIGFVQSPDNRIFRSYPGATKSSSDNRFKVEPRAAGALGEGFQFSGASETGGIWRFSIVATETRPAEALGRHLAGRTVIENLALYLYALAGRPSSGALADWVATHYPEVAQLNSRIPAKVTISLGEPDSDINDGNDGGGDNLPPITPAPTRFQIEAIVATEDVPPGRPRARFTNFSNPLIDDRGRVAFFAGYRGGIGNAGLYVYEDGALRRVFDNDPNLVGAAAGLNDGEFFGGFRVNWDDGSPTLAWGSDGRLMFAAHLSGSAMPDAVFRWRASDGDLLRIVDNASLQALIPGASTDFLPEFFHPAVSDAGVASFSARYSFFDVDRNFTLFNTGLFTTDGATLSPVAAQQLQTPGEVPGQDANAQFSTVHLLYAANAGGDLLFQAQHTGTNGNRGVYLLREGQITRIVDNGDGRSFPGLPAGAQVGPNDGEYEAIALGDNGQIAIDTVLIENGVESNAVIYWNGSTWTRLASNGNRAGELLSGINIRGTLVFRAGGRPFVGNEQSATDVSTRVPAELSGVQLDWPAFGASINNQDRALIRFQRTGDGTPGVLFWDGQSLLPALDLADADFSTFDVIFSATQDDVRGELDDRGVVK